MYETPDPLPEGERNAPEYFLRCTQSGREPEGVLNPETALIAQAIIEQAKE